MRTRVDVHAGDRLAVRREQTDKAMADESGTADDKDGHLFPSHEG
jgi:hypothetical protein